MKIRARLELARFRLSHTGRLARGIFIGTWVWLPFATIAFIQGKATPIPPSSKIIYSILTIGICLLFCLFGKFLPELREINRRHNNELNAIRRKYGIPEKF